MDVGAARQSFDKESAHAVEQSGCQEYSESCTGQGQHESFREQLRNDPLPAGADGHPHSHLAFALDAARHQEAGDVDAADSENGEDRAEQRPQRSLRFSGDAIGEKLQVHRTAFVRGIRAGEVGKYLGQVSLGLGHRDAGFDSAHGLQPVIAAAVHPPLVEVNGNVDRIASTQWKAESGGHNADDAEATAIQLDRFAYRAAIAVEVRLPHLVTQHDNVVFAFLLFAGQESAADERLNVENLEEVVSTANAAERNGFAAGREQRGFAVV